MKKQLLAIVLILVSFAAKAQLSGALRTQNIELGTTGFLGFGDQTTTGDWRFTIINDTIARQRYNGSSWVTVPFSSGTGGPDGNDNDFVSAGSFNTSNGNVTLTIPNQTNVVFGLDGRYSLTSHSHSLVNLDDVTITSITSGEILKWNGTAYINNTLAEAGIEPAITKNNAFNKSFGTAAGTVAQGNDSRILNGQIAHDWGDHSAAGYEPAFPKNTGFNLNLGTTAGTVAEGNDSRINNGQIAWSWGNHASAGYITGEVQSLFDVLARGSAGIFTNDISIDNSGAGSSFELLDFLTINWTATNLTGTFANVAINNTNPAEFTGGVEVGATAPVRLGEVTEGAWRIIRVGSNLEVQRYESSTWVTKGQFTP